MKQTQSIPIRCVFGEEDPQEIILRSLCIFIEQKLRETPIS